MIISNEISSPKTERSRGFILITSYMLLSTLILFSVALFIRGSIFIQSAERNKKKIIAFNAAEAGFDNVFYQLKTNAITTFPYSSGYVSLNTGNLEGGYSVTVTDMGNNIRQISTTGYSPSQSSTTQSVEFRTVTGYVLAAASTGFNFGIFAKNSITMSGNAQVDAYDSSVGAYGGSNVITNSTDVGTDSTGAGTVTLSGNATIQGNAIVGKNGNPASVITTSGNAIITGSESAATANQNPPVATTSISSSGSLAISGNTNYQLPAGTYHYTSLSISGNGKLTPLGKVTLYVDGTISIAGNGIATVSNKPTNFIIYETGTSSVSLSGNGNLYAGIYAPNSAISNSGNGQLYGALVSNTYSQSGNGNVHFDKALISGSGSSNSMSLLSWQETNKTASG